MNRCRQNSRIYLRVTGRMIGNEQIGVLGFDLGESLLRQLMIPDAHNVPIEIGITGRSSLELGVSLGPGEIRALVETNGYLLSQTTVGAEKKYRDCDDA